ncbi:MAG: vWA domain-containing protein [Planctomycetota bacterium]
MILVVTLAPAARGDDYERHYKAFREYMGRRSFRLRVRGIERLAATGDPRALKVLRKVYAKPPKGPKSQTKYIVASIAWDRLGEENYASQWAEWRNKHKGARDAWLWFRALDVDVMASGPATATAVANGKQNIFLRAAAVHAVGVFHEPDVLQMIPKFLEKRPETGLDRALLVEACGRALVRQVNEFGTDDYRAAALKLMRQFDLKQTPMRTRWVLARCFARIFKSDKVYLDSSKPWRAMLVAKDATKVKVDPRYAPPKRPTFIGIEATGKRIVYVIDMSDSMLTPLNPREKSVMKGPVSGSRAKKEEKPKKDEANPLPGEKDLNWKKIKTRFDAAREYLKLSLASLQPDMHYAVIWFGEGADFFRSTRGLVPATTASIKNTVSELNAIRAGPKGDNRPHGTLRGTTNMHGGLRRAFMLKGKTLAKRNAYVDPQTFSGGCDTIFLLSDGDPSWDDWGMTDQRDKGDLAGDPEMGGGGNQDATSLNYAGPYANNRHLLEDVQRMNLFRQVEIHCVGIGEANRGFLAQLSATGLGRVRMMGKGPSHLGTGKKPK